MTDQNVIAAREARTALPDLIVPGLSGVFCGLNPGLAAAAVGHHFEGRGNRFWRAVHLAGFTERELKPAEDVQLLKYGFGLATVVCRPTASASELSKDEYVAAAEGLLCRLNRFRPTYIAFLGKDAYATMSQRKHVTWGLQHEPLGTAKVWLLPNPSGRNRGFSLAELVEAYREFRLAAVGDVEPCPAG
ncbi:G/U mismatch-specific DNA glycosylase [Cupriavidus pauculus]|uniref:G/U mismatch-specific DNA glycosylase n=1 Tax=Cupriavidus pauculus TaxID=82633 RepID=A0A2N5CCM9_9BURK|nr:G/U mismatch-specific DNA glycosylase [Cupriavidus pauculus]PLQ00011.1 G/U mismatch-specific DNA glycosylase [Cupriavidus pauculus]